MQPDELDFERIHDEFRPKILRFLDGMAGPAEAEELAQETMLKVSRSLEHFRGEAKLSTWIFRIAANVALDRLRSRAFKESRRGRSIDGDDSAARLYVDKDVWTGEEKPAAAEKLIRGQMNQCIRNVIDALPEDYRSVILLSEFEDLKNNEIAEIMNTTTGAVKIRLHRARAKLRQALQNSCTFSRNEQNEFVCDPKN